MPNKSECGIYSITSPTNKVYIGLSRNIRRRWIEHKASAANKNSPLQHSILKYGAKNHVFKILHELPVDISNEILNRFETVYFDQFKYCGFEMLNLMPTGINFIDYKNPIRNEKIRKARKGQKQSLNQRAKTSARMKEYKHSEESKRKIGLANSLRIWKPESRDKKAKANIGNSFHLGKKHTPESIEKMKQTKLKNKEK